MSGAQIFCELLQEMQYFLALSFQELNLEFTVEKSLKSRYQMIFIELMLILSEWIELQKKYEIDMCILTDGYWDLRNVHTLHTAPYQLK